MVGTYMCAGGCVPGCIGMSKKKKDGGEWMRYRRRRSGVYMIHYGQIVRGWCFDLARTYVYYFFCVYEL